MMSCDEGVEREGGWGGGAAAHTERVTSDWTGLRVVCGCQDFLNQVSGSQIDVSQADVEKKLQVPNCKWQRFFIIF